MRYYISIEKNIEGFEFYKSLWQKLGVIGVRADTMTEGIRKAVEIEKSKTNELYFIDIVADDIHFMPQLKALSTKTDAPILIATSKSYYNVDEHHEALNNGADFYGPYCEKPEQNINAVLAVVTRITERNLQQQEKGITLSDGTVLSLSKHHALINNIDMELTKKEFDIFYYLAANPERVLSFDDIIQYVWDYGYGSEKCVWTLIGRMRNKLAPVSGCIKNVHGIGYKFTTRL